MECDDSTMCVLPAIVLDARSDSRLEPSDEEHAHARGRAKNRRKTAAAATRTSHCPMTGIDRDLGQYPILCRVEETLAEFPYDPNLDYKKFDKDGNITWVLPGSKMNTFKTHHGHPTIRHRLQLRPLTPIIPPHWDKESGEPKEGFGDLLLASRFFCS